jgi:hypothetical protein
VFAGYPYAARMAFFSAVVTLRGRSLLDTHACDVSIAPGVNLASGTVQKPLDLSMSIFRQGCAKAALTNRRTSKWHFMVSFQINYRLPSAARISFE